MRRRCFCQDIFENIYRSRSSKSVRTCAISVCATRISTKKRAKIHKLFFRSCCKKCAKKNCRLRLAWKDLLWVFMCREKALKQRVMFSSSVSGRPVLQSELAETEGSWTNFPTSRKNLHMGFRRRCTIVGRLRIQCRGNFRAEICVSAPLHRKLWCVFVGDF